MKDRQVALYYAECASLWAALAMQMDIAEMDDESPDAVSPEGYSKTEDAARWLLEELFETDDKYSENEKTPIYRAIDVEGRIGDRAYFHWLATILATAKDIPSRSDLSYVEILRYVLHRSFLGLVQEAGKIFEDQKSKAPLTYLTKGKPCLDELALWLQNESTRFETHHDLGATEKQKVESAVQQVMDDWRSLTAAAAQSILG